MTASDTEYDPRMDTTTDFVCTLRHLPTAPPTHPNTSQFQRVPVAWDYSGLPVLGPANRRVAVRHLGAAPPTHAGRHGTLSLTTARDLVAVGHKVAHAVRRHVGVRFSSNKFTVGQGFAKVLLELDGRIRLWRREGEDVGHADSKPKALASSVEQPPRKRHRKTQ